MGEKILPQFREKVKRFFKKFTKSTQFLKPFTDKNNRSPVKTLTRFVTYLLPNLHI